MLEQQSTTNKKTLSIKTLRSKAYGKANNCQTGHSSQPARNEKVPVIRICWLNGRMHKNTRKEKMFADNMRQGCIEKKRRQGVIRLQFQSRPLDARFTLQYNTRSHLSSWRSPADLPPASAWPARAATLSSAGRPGSLEWWSSRRRCLVGPCWGSGSWALSTAILCALRASARTLPPSGAWPPAVGTLHR